MLPKQYSTALETVESGEIINILNTICAKKTSFGVTDYIGTALDNIDNAKDRVANAIKQLQEVKKGLDYQEEVIKCEVAKWLAENGIDRIEGDAISSITIFDKAPKQEVIIDDENAIDASYCKLTVDKTAVKKAINEGIEVKGARLEITHNDPSIRLNKKKVQKMDELGF